MERPPVHRAPAWLRRITDHPRLLPLTALGLRALQTRAPVRFAVGELAGRGRRVYRVRGLDARVCVRHGGGDAVTVGEVFHTRDYEPPPALQALAPARILDLGANAGYFGAFAQARWPGAQIVAYEPDPANAATHELTMAANPHARWELRRAAAGAHDGELRFHASGDALSHADATGDLVVDVCDVLDEIAAADLVKIDIEGGEWDLVGDARFRPPVVVLEYHPAAGIADPRTAMLDALRVAGLEQTHEIFARADGHGMLWAWRT